MSILSKNNSNKDMGLPLFHEFTRQASFFFKEKIKAARLALTDVTPAQLLTEEATAADSSVPDSRILASISKAAFELENYWGITQVLHSRLSKFERRNWRVSYNSLVVLEHLLTHGPESAAAEFQCDKLVISEMKKFQHIDERGFNWGLAVRKKSERILKLIEKGPFLREERDRARKLSRGIQGFGSFCQRSSQAHNTLQESPRGTYGRSNSYFNSQECKENQYPFKDNTGSNPIKGVAKSVECGEKEERLMPRDSLCEEKTLEEPKFETIFYENMAPSPGKEELHVWSGTGESNMLLGGKNGESMPRNLVMEEDHPFNNTENQSTASLLSARDGIVC